MFDYMTVQEAAARWGISERRIQKLCGENRIPGVVRLSRVWLIPKEAGKPADARKKQNSIYCPIHAKSDAVANKSPIS